MSRTAQAACLGAKDSLSPTIAVVIAGVVNAALDWFMVIQLRMGIRGAAWATVICQVVAAAVLMRSMLLKGLTSWAYLGRRRPDIQHIRAFFAFGPFMFVLFMKLVTYNQMVLLATRLGPMEAAAHQVMYSLSRFCFTLGDVCSATAQSYVPQFYVKPREMLNRIERTQALRTMTKIVG